MRTARLQARRHRGARNGVRGPREKPILKTLLDVAGTPSGTGAGRRNGV
jgi:hypothetical protein